MLLAPFGHAQDLNDLRNKLREDLRSTHFGQSLISLVLLSDELELGGGSFSINDEASTAISTISLPFHSKLEPWGRSDWNLYCEGAFGYTEAKQTTADIYGGVVPPLATSVASRWRSYGVVGGIGVDYQLREGLNFSPILNASVAHIDNRSDFGGPGAGFTAAIADGIAFNWDALAITYGAAGRLDWRHQISDRRRLDVVARYDIRWSETVQTDDPAQEFSVRSQMMTVRGDLYGPTHLTLWDAPLDWQLTFGYRYFPEVRFFEVRDYFEVGGSLLNYCGDKLPLGTGLGLSVTGFFGQDFSGWTVGLRLLF